MSGISEAVVNANSISNDLAKIRETKPLVHSITNLVVMEQTANALLALGASPIMAHAQEEVADMINIVQALVLNIGTLEKAWVDSMKLALQAANNKGIPVILDPVGAGATPLRTNTVLELLQLGKVDVIRGNAAEIMAVAGCAIESKGVDSQYATDSALQACRELAKQYHCVVVASGSEDIIVNAGGKYTIANGQPIMSLVTGTGCSATAVIGAYCAVNRDYLAAATHAMATMGIAGEIAATQAQGPASWQVNFHDALYQLSQQQIAEHLQLKN